VFTDKDVLSSINSLTIPFVCKKLASLFNLNTRREFLEISWNAETSLCLREQYAWLLTKDNSEFAIGYIE